jgi:hypothetical protein
MSTKDIFHDFTDHEGTEWRRTPRQFLESIDFAMNEINYSNYDCHNLEMVKEIVRRYCKEHEIKLGPSRKQLDHIKHLKDQAFRNKMEKYKDDPIKLLELLRTRKMIP